MPPRKAVDVRPHSATAGVVRQQPAQRQQSRPIMVLTYLDLTEAEISAFSPLLPWAAERERLGLRARA